MGYGGTKDEMERLIADAEEYSAAMSSMSFEDFSAAMKDTGMSAEELRQKYETLTNSTNLSIGSFSDVVTAIDLIQMKQGIAGTTAREAATTIEGSVGMAKAAWSNWVTELGKDNADMEARTDELVDSVITAAGNIVPRITTIASTLIRTLPTAISQLGSSLLPAVVELGGSLLAAVGNIVTELVTNVLPNAFAQIGSMFSDIDIATLMEELRLKFEDGIASLSEWLHQGGSDMLDVTSIVFEKAQGVVDAIMENIPSIVEGMSKVLVSIGDTIMENTPTFLKQAGDFFANFLKSIGDSAPKWAQAFSNAVKGLIDLVIQNGPNILRAAAEFFSQILNALIDNAPKVLSALLGTLVDLIGYIITHIPEILSAAVEFFGSILDALMNAIPHILAGLGQLILDAVGAIAGGVGDMINAGIEFVGGLLEGAVQKGQDVLNWFANLPNNVLNALGNLGSWLFNEGHNLLNGFLNGIKDTFENVRNWFLNLPQRILNAIGSLGKLLETQGHNVLVGFWNGMIGVWNDLTGWIGGIGQWIADHKGPKEYDLKLLVRNGGWIMEGLGGGMRKAFEGEVLPYVESMADEISDAMLFKPSVLGIDTNSIPEISTDSYGVGGVGKYINITIERMETHSEQDVYDLSRNLAALVNREESATLWTL